MEYVVLDSCRILQWIIGFHLSLIYLITGNGSHHISSLHIHVSLLRFFTAWNENAQIQPLGPFKMRVKFWSA